MAYLPARGSIPARGGEDGSHVGDALSAPGPIGAMSGPWPRRRARLSSHSQSRVLHPRLGKAGHAAGFASRLTTRRTIRSLLRGALSAMSRVSAVSAWGLLVQRARGRLPAGRNRQPVFVELEEPLPGVGITRDEIQHGPPGLVHQRLVLQRPGQEIQRLTCLAQAALGKPPLVQRVTADQMFAQGTCGPPAKAHSPLRVDPVAHGDGWRRGRSA